MMQCFILFLQQGLCLGFCTRPQVNVINHFKSRWYANFFFIEFYHQPFPTHRCQYWTTFEESTGDAASSSLHVQHLKCVAFSLNLYKLEFLWRYYLKFSLVCFHLWFFSRRFLRLSSVLPLIQKEINKQAQHSTLFFYTLLLVFSTVFIHRHAVLHSRIFD